MRRRQILTASAMAMAGLAGCTGGDSTNEADTEGSPVVTTVEEFYTTLYENNDIEGANAMYHPDTESREMRPSDFEPFGGIESIKATIVSTEVVSQTDSTAEVHVEVTYNTPLGSATNEDWLTMRTNDGEWFVDYYLSDEARSDMSQAEIEEVMNQS
ncbi:hypothetical protein EGH24_00435 [Halonotius terrestris]|uniref:DUF4878 domain-containing protein n=1 Tax=Halonotius terrestris TaxID=2487750 RepID=A0A8J8TD99_9EURY|nr:hypothetical protein [Halonotius terrestris]TQQ83306.1 hypothetical protein EGH24_00435 [Halonotius terrestris]